MRHLNRFRAGVGVQAHREGERGPEQRLVVGQVRQGRHGVHPGEPAHGHHLWGDPVLREKLDEANVELCDVVGLSLCVHDEDEEDKFADEGSLSRT